MALQDLLNLHDKKSGAKIGLSEERVNAIKSVGRQYIAYWREYPDMFIDYLQTGNDPTRKKKLNFYFYQRVFLRVAMRYQLVYAVYPRAYSKSFLSVLVMMIRCILYPGAKLFSSAGGKEQAAGILKEKVGELCTLVPALKREIDWGRGSDTMEGKDYCRYAFKNGSYFDNVAAQERSRGKRRHGGLLEECASMDGQVLQEVLLPMMNVSRMCLDGTTQHEPLNQSQLYITTAGYKSTFAYEMLIQLLVNMLIDPNKAFIMGGTYRVPVDVGLIPKNFVDDLKQNGAFNEAGFEREYESKWSGTVEDAFFDGEAFDRNRILQKPENEASGRTSKQGYYILSVDVGRRGCQSVVCVFKVTPQSTGTSIKSLVNIYTFDDEHFEDQAIRIKKLFYKYKAKRVVIDGNGLGIGLVDYMVKSQIDKNGDTYPDFGVYNDEENFYKKFRTAETEDAAMYIIKANAPINTEAHSIVQSQIESGKVKFLISEKLAKNKLLGTKVGQAMKPEERAEYLKSFTLTDILKEEMLNLREENEGVNIILKQANKGIKKDKFSAFEYGLYYIKQEEDSKKKKHHGRMSDFMFMN